MSLSPSAAGRSSPPGDPDLCRVQFTNDPAPNATTVAHEVFHCFQFQLGPDLAGRLRQPGVGIIEGSAEWAGARSEAWTTTSSPLCRVAFQHGFIVRARLYWHRLTTGPSSRWGESSVSDRRDAGHRRHRRRGGNRTRLKDVLNRVSTARPEHPIADHSRLGSVGLLRRRRTQPRGAA